jgi:threonine dehydrogenase-like Zn-dependent dehydrogenase
MLAPGRRYSFEFRRPDAQPHRTSLSLEKDEANKDEVERENDEHDGPSVVSIYIAAMGFEPFANRNDRQPGLILSRYYSDCEKPTVPGRSRPKCCRNFGTVSIVGVYGGMLDNIPMGSAINRGLTFRMAQTPVQHYLPKLMERIEKGEIDPSFVITHRATLDEGPDLYKTFRAKKDGCIKVVMKPFG